MSRTVIVSCPDLDRPPQRQNYRRGQSAVVHFSLEEDIVIESLRVEGLGTTAIAAVLTGLGTRRSPATVNMRLKTLAAWQERD